MSAYIVEDSVIDALVTYAAENLKHSEHVAEKTPDQIGQMLVDENHRSVNFRYRESDEAPRYIHRQYTGPMDAVQIIKAAQCYSYQASECDDYENTSARALTYQIIDSATYKLAGYSDAQWGMPTNPARGGKGPVSLISLLQG